MTDYNELYAKAASADKGEWLPKDSYARLVDRPARDFIAAASPEVVMRLIEERVRLRDALRSMIETHGEPCREKISTCEDCESVKQAKAALYGDSEP